MDVCAANGSICEGRICGYHRCLRIICRVVLFPFLVPTRVWKREQRSWSSFVAVRHVELAPWVRALRTVL